MNSLCECGCGERVSKPGNRFVLGHNWRGKSGPNTPNWQGGKRELACLFCGETILRKRNQAGKYSKHFCHIVCRAQWLSENRTGRSNPAWTGGPIEVNCAVCGETILRTKYQADRCSDHFCDMACKAQWLSENLIGPNTPNWQGGKSFEPYGLGFNDALRLAVRERDEFTCQLCAVRENGRAHDCHHADYVKVNNDPENLTTLCQDCHRRTNYNRAFWTNLFQVQVKLNEWSYRT